MSPWSVIDLVVSTAMLVILYSGTIWRLRTLRGTVRALRAIQFLNAAAFVCLAVGGLTLSLPLLIAGLLVTVLANFFVGTVVELAGGPDPTWAIRHEIKAIMPLLQPQPLTDDRRMELETRRAALSGLRSPVTNRTVAAIDKMIA